MNGLTIKDLIIKSAQTAITMQNSHGTFPSGHNGPWKNIDTPVRVTAHWTVLLLTAYKLSGDLIYKESALNACSYLLGSEARPHNFSFLCSTSHKEILQCNGLIGQVWAIEALIEAGIILKSDEYFCAAKDVILKHAFNKHVSLWHCLGPTGKILEVHKTLNHQIWFSLLVYRLGKIMNNQELIDVAETFFINLTNFIKFRGSIIEMKINEHVFLKSSIREFCREKRKNIRNRTNKVMQSRGYVSFTLMGLALIYDFDQNLSIWDNAQLKYYIEQSIVFLDTQVNAHDFNQNTYTFSYNPTGIEVAVVKDIFSHYVPVDRISKRTWLTKQFHKHYDYDKNIMNKQTDDPNTLAARIYEITRLRKDSFEIYLKNGNVED